MPTRTQLKCILNLLKPLVLHPDSDKPISPDFQFVTSADLHRLDVAAQDLKGEAYYDGLETNGDGERVYVFMRSKLLEHVGRSWGEFEQNRRFQARQKERV